jgi:hypothetical protein
MIHPSTSQPRLCDSPPRAPPSPRPLDSSYARGRIQQEQPGEESPGRWAKGVLPVSADLRSSGTSVACPGSRAEMIEKSPGIHRGTITPGKGIAL